MSRVDQKIPPIFTAVAANSGMQSAETPRSEEIPRTHS